MKRILMSTLSTVIFLLTLSFSVMADDVPAWLRQAASINPTARSKEVKAVVLHDESRITVNEDGSRTNTTTWAVKILSREARNEAVAETVYNTSSEKVKELKAWMIRPSGQVIKYGKDQIVDMILVDNDIYNDVRRRKISGADDVEAGSVFGFEAVTEEKSVFSQFQWFFQGEHPVVASRIIVTVPQGWRAEGKMRNHAQIEPAVNGVSYVWELRDLDLIKSEPDSPSSVNLAASIAISLFPPAGKGAGMLRTFASWQEVSSYLSELADPQIQLDDEIAGKARELIAGAKTEFEKIQAIGRYAQNIKYVSIQIGTGRGGGYRPHPAIEVFKKSYGDCKDKANLMRAMLKAVGITAYPVVIYSGDPTMVREEWPSPQQFNHCIIAVKVSDDLKAATTISHPKLGRLMIFDPTDDDTPVGDLPHHEQGSLALIVAGADGALMKMPRTPPDLNRLERQTEVVLNADGGITASLSERSQGQAAVKERRWFRAMPGADYQKMIERWVTYHATGAKIAKVAPTDSQSDGRFTLGLDFSVAAYAQNMRGRLLIFRPAILSRRAQVYLTEPSRVHPIVLESESFAETVRVKLPEGFDIDEIPDATQIETSFGKYSASWEIRDGMLIFKRDCVIQPGVIPASEYKMVRGFFERMRGAELAPVVLAKK